MNPVILQPGLRPTFVLESPHPRERVIGMVERSLREAACPFSGMVLEDRVRLCLPRELRRAWSPELELHLRQEEDRLIIEGQFGPDPGAWTLFMALYAFVVLGAGLGLLFGSSQWMLDRPPMALLALPPAALALALLHLAAHRGQRATRHQMEALGGFVMEVLDQLEDAPPES